MICKPPLQALAAAPTMSVSDAALVLDAFASFNFRCALTEWFNRNALYLSNESEQFDFYQGGPCEDIDFLGTLCSCINFCRIFVPSNKLLDASMLPLMQQHKGKFVCTCLVPTHTKSVHACVYAQAQ